MKLKEIEERLNLTEDYNVTKLFESLVYLVHNINFDYVSTIHGEFPCIQMRRSYDSTIWFAVRFKKLVINKLEFKLSFKQWLEYRKEFKALLYTVSKLSSKKSDSENKIRLCDLIAENLTKYEFENFSDDNE
jgi:hypothetical protein